MDQLRELITRKWPDVDWGLRYHWTGSSVRMWSQIVIHNWYLGFELLKIFRMAYLKYWSGLRYWGFEVLSWTEVLNQPGPVIWRCWATTQSSFWYLYRQSILSKVSTMIVFTGIIKLVSLCLLFEFPNPRSFCWLFVQSETIWRPHLSLSHHCHGHYTSNI